MHIFYFKIALFCTYASELLMRLLVNRLCNSIYIVSHHSIDAGLTMNL